VDSRQRQDLDRYITGNYGEDQFAPSEYSFPDTAHANYLIDNGAWLTYDPTDEGPEVHTINIERINAILDEY
jgi:hypothetical protein